MAGDLARKLGLGLAVVAAVVVYLWFVHAPAGRRLAAIESESASLIAEAKEAEAALAEAARFRGNEIAIRDESRRLRQKFPSGNPAPAVIHDLSTLAAASGVKIHTIQPGISAGASFTPNGEGMNPIPYTEIPISMELTGSYGAIVKYLASLGDLAQMVVLRKAKLLPGDRGIDAGLELSTYMVKQP